MTGKDSNVSEAKALALRLQRLYLAQSNYFIGYVLIAVAWLSGEYVGNTLTFISHFVLGIVTQFGFWLAFKSGFNKRFTDPSLTNIQIVTGTLLVTYLIIFLGDLRGSMLLLYPMGVIFGVFGLSMRAYVLHSVLALGGYSVVLAFEFYFDLSQRDPTVQLMEWFALSCFLSWLCVVASYVRKLREELQQRHSTLKSHQETLKGMMGQLQDLAATDSLTGLANRRHFIDESRRRIQLLGPGKTLGIALVDLDHFKLINDNYGHAAGDEVLQGFARVAAENLRGGDLVARFGGEEFILLLNNSDMVSLQHCLNRIRNAFSQTQFTCLPEGTFCTLSAGLTLVYPGDELDACISDADHALYRAKNSGRNRCEVFEPAHA
ncbi:GGDEF domain-containing protein [Pseudomonas sp. gcc21]|uniref:GGDEF domain-containing protein n=1 Tax=Pseudomonas sp. gcc21 TaxID=2726989 RepID=UPI001451B0FA|nr:GGDEF domain-containing protein [Pseudomonas sp. gcc21]QJD58780.1 GGDEF domain-containing protein [Pseudomonas sp. gcc21]